MSIYSTTPAPFLRLSQSKRVLSMDSLQKDIVDAVIWFSGKEAEIITNCSNCPHHTTKIFNYPIRIFTGSRMKSSCCITPNNILLEHKIIYEDHTTTYKPFITIPPWCLLRRQEFLTIPLTTSDWTLIEDIILHLDVIGRFAVIAASSQGLSLLMKGTLTPDVKELLVEVLI